MDNILPRKNNEVKSQYKDRLRVYKAVYEETKSDERALITSNIYINVKYFGNKYAANLQKDIEPFL